MAIQIRTYPIVESVINLLGDWFKHRQEMRELREINSGDFARIAHDLCVTPAELDIFVRRDSHASHELPRLLKSLGIDEATLSRTQPSFIATRSVSAVHATKRPGVTAISTPAPPPSIMRNIAPTHRRSTSWARGRNRAITFGG
jgi:hypothetical protein